MLIASRNSPKSNARWMLKNLSKLFDCYFVKNWRLYPIPLLCYGLFLPISDVSRARNQIFFFKKWILSENNITETDGTTIYVLKVLSLPVVDTGIYKTGTNNIQNWNRILFNYFEINWERWKLSTLNQKSFNKRRFMESTMSFEKWLWCLSSSSSSEWHLRADWPCQKSINTIPFSDWMYRLALVCCSYLFSKWPSHT